MFVDIRNFRRYDFGVGHSGASDIGAVAVTSGLPPRSRFRRAQLKNCAFAGIMESGAPVETDHFDSPKSPRPAGSNFTRRPARNSQVKESRN